MLKKLYVQLDNNDKILETSEVPKENFKEIILDVDDESDDEVVKFIELIKGTSTYNLYEGNLTGVTIEDVEWGSTRSIIKEMFLRGCCGRFSMILKNRFPQGESYFLTEDDIHVITKINDRFYDIEGDVTDKYKEKPMRIITDYEIYDECIDNNYSFNTRGPIL